MYLVAIFLMCLHPLWVFGQIEKLLVWLVMFYKLQNINIKNEIGQLLLAIRHRPYLCLSVNSRYSSGGFIFCKLKSILFWISLNVSAVKSQYCDASCMIFFLMVQSNKENRNMVIEMMHVQMCIYSKDTHQIIMKSSWIDCWCSRRPGNRIVRKSTSISDASLINSTYSLCARCNFRQAFWYLSRTSSNLRPPRPAKRSVRFNFNPEWVLEAKWNSVWCVTFDIMFLEFGSQQFVIF